MEVKDEYAHDLAKTYSALDAAEKILSGEEEEVLRVASAIYTGRKGFDYPQPIDAAQRFRHYPDLTALTGVARKMIG